MKSATELLEKRFDVKIIPPFLTEVYDYLHNTSYSKNNSNKNFVDKSTESDILYEYIEKNNLYNKKE